MQLKKYEAQVPEHEKLYPYWLRDRLDVIPKVYAQQKEMHENGTHKCEDRIVSLQQPHVRPINRGKRPNPTEFGQKLHLSVVDGFTYLEKTSFFIAKIFRNPIDASPNVFAPRNDALNGVPLTFKAICYRRGVQAKFLEPDHGFVV